MRYVICAIAALFALLHLVAAVAQWKSQPESQPRSIIMLCGAGAMLAACVRTSLSWLPALCGGVLICTAAILNGRAAGKIHPAHHMVRIVIAALIVISFIIF